MAGAVSLDGLEEAHSFIDLVRYGAQDVFQRPGPLVQLLELWLSPVNHELWKNTVRQEEKKKNTDRQTHWVTGTATHMQIATGGHRNEAINIGSMCVKKKKTSPRCICIKLTQDHV